MGVYVQCTRRGAQSNVLPNQQSAEGARSFAMASTCWWNTHELSAPHHPFTLIYWRGWANAMLVWRYDILWLDASCFADEIAPLHRIKMHARSSALENINNGTYNACGPATHISPTDVCTSQIEIANESQRWCI